MRKLYYFKANDNSIIGTKGYGWENALSDLRYLMPKVKFVSYCTQGGEDIVKF